MLTLMTWAFPFVLIIEVNPMTTTLGLEINLSQKYEINTTWLFKITKYANIMYKN